MKFIQLTKFYRVRIGVPYDGLPVWINPEYIVALETSTAGIVTPESYGKPVAEQPIETYTIVSMLGAEADSDGITYNVKETPQEIMTLLGTEDAA